MSDLGFIQALGVAVTNPLPISWLGRVDAPSSLPSWANIDQLTSVQNTNLLAQIGYDKSRWNYRLIGSQNQLGRYQFSTQTLENYGLLARGSNAYYGTDCINYTQCWKPVTIRNANSYANYIYNVNNLSGFLNSPVSQDHLAYQMIYDVCRSLINIDAIISTDSADIIAGMIYVGWELDPGSKSSFNNATGTGAYAWRFSGQGAGTIPFNSGRYSSIMLG